MLKIFCRWRLNSSLKILVISFSIRSSVRYVCFHIPWPSWYYICRQIAFTYLIDLYINRTISFRSSQRGHLKTLSTQMGYPIGIHIWVLQKHIFIKVVYEAAVNKTTSNQNCGNSPGFYFNKLRKIH